MAKSKSFFGLRRGSTKSLTFQVLNGQQITKDRVTEVKNPKTNGQIMQRMKLAAATNIYRYFKTYIDRGQQGVCYGIRSRQEWLKQVLAGDALYTPKGTNTLLPWTFPITRGSLTPFAYNWDGEISNLRVPANDNMSAIPDREWINANEQLQDGDQITVICMTRMPLGEYVIKQASHVLNASDDASSLVDKLDEKGIIMEKLTIGDAPEEGEEDTRYDIATVAGASGQIAGTCVILSRLNGSAYERSTQMFKGTPQVFTPNFRALAADSYRDAAARSTDWPEVILDGFIPFGTASVFVKNDDGQSVQALCVYGFNGNQYKIFAVTTSGDKTGNLYSIDGSESSVKPNDAFVGNTPAADYFSDGYWSKATYDEYFA